MEGCFRAIHEEQIVDVSMSACPYEICSTWEVVFSLPRLLTATALCAASPKLAAHSRRADMAISRPMMAAYSISQTPLENNSQLHAVGAIIPEDMEGMIQELPAKWPALIGLVHRRIRMLATISLSATGSRKAPKGVLWSCGR